MLCRSWERPILAFAHLQLRALASLGHRFAHVQAKKGCRWTWRCGRDSARFDSERAGTVGLCAGCVAAAGMPELTRYASPAGLAQAPQPADSRRCGPTNPVAPSCRHRPRASRPAQVPTRSARLCAAGACRALGRGAASGHPLGRPRVTPSQPPRRPHRLGSRHLTRQLLAALHPCLQPRIDLRAEQDALNGSHETATRPGDRQTYRGASVNAAQA